MPEIDNVISCLKKIKQKSFRQNKENLTNYLVQDYGYDKGNATELIEQAVEDEAVKNVQFNGKDYCKRCHHNTCTRYTIY